QLTDREIETALKNGQIVVSPQPDFATALSSTTLDLTLSDRFATWKSIAGTAIHPGQPGYSYKNLEQMQDKIQAKSFTLNPGAFVLGWTAEEVELPFRSRIAARVEGKSSLARLGVGIHVTAPTIHSGFSGNIQLEIFNSGPHTVVLDQGMAVCQLIFEQTYGTPNKGYGGIFAGQKAAGI
ncbi:dCTP deaminase, partial [Methylorubrum thiocyanatum]